MTFVVTENRINPLDVFNPPLYGFRIYNPMFPVTRPSQQDYGKCFVVEVPTVAPPNNLLYKISVPFGPQIPGYGNAMDDIAGCIFTKIKQAVLFGIKGAYPDLVLTSACNTRASLTLPIVDIPPGTSDQAGYQTFYFDGNKATYISSVSSEPPSIGTASMTLFKAKLDVELPSRTQLPTSFATWQYSAIGTVPPLVPANLDTSYQLVSAEVFAGSINADMDYDCVTIGPAVGAEDIYDGKTVTFDKTTFRIKNIKGGTGIDVTTDPIDSGLVVTLDASLSDLNDVSATPPTGGDVLTYSAISGEWEPQPGTANSLSTLTDVSLGTLPAPSGPQDQVLSYDSNTALWTNREVLQLHQWVFDGAVVTPPPLSDQKFGFDTSDPTLATSMYVSKIDKVSQSSIEWLVATFIGTNSLQIHTYGATLTFDLTAPAIDYPAHVEFPVTFISKIGVVTEPAIGQGCFFDVIFSAGPLGPTNNYTALIDPTTSDDSVAGYTVGSVWLNTVTTRFFICENATPTLAVWRAISVDISPNLSVVVGDQAITGTTLRSVAIGYLSSVSTTNPTDTYCVAVGANASVTANQGTAVGGFAVASKSGAVALGSETTSDGINSIVSGYQVACSHDNCVVLSTSTNSANSQRSVAIGYVNSSSGDSSVLIGDNSIVSAADTVAIGSACSATAASAVAVGKSADATGVDSISIGLNSASSGSSGIAIGNASTASAQSCIAIGHSSVVNNNDGIAIGHTASSTNVGSIAIGDSSTVSSNESLAVGKGSTCSSLRGVAIGHNSSCTQAHGLAIGSSSSSASPDPLFALGFNGSNPVTSTSQFNRLPVRIDTTNYNFLLRDTDLALDDISDVVITGTPSDKQVLRWDSATSKWVNATENISDLGDVVITGTPSDKQVLRWDSGTSKWVNATENFVDLGDVLPGDTLATGAQLFYNSSGKWTNRFPRWSFPKVVEAATTLNGTTGTQTFTYFGGWLYDGSTQAFNNFAVIFQVVGTVTVRFAIYNNNGGNVVGSTLKCQSGSFVPVVGVNTVVLTPQAGQDNIFTYNTSYYCVVSIVSTGLSTRIIQQPVGFNLYSSFYNNVNYVTGGFVATLGVASTATTGYSNNIILTT
jgi:hypothetical protein